MDTDLFLSSGLIFLALFVAFFSSVLLSLSQDALNNIVKLKTQASERLNKLSMEYEDNVYSFLLLEITLYATAFLTLGASAIEQYDSRLRAFAHLLIFVIFIIIGRSFFHSLGMRLSDSIALKTTPVLSLLYVISKPFGLTVRGFNRLLGSYNEEEETRDELSALVETAHEEGSLDTEEYRLLKNIMKFSEILVADVMTPRTVVFSLEYDAKVGDVVNMKELRMYSRIPVWELSPDEGMKGYVLTKDILLAALNDQLDEPISNFVREVYFISEDANLDVALEKFLQRRQHLFVVVDEYGGFDGLITMEDVMETILGVEIVDEGDRIVDLRLLAKNRRDKRVAKKVKKTEEI